MNHFVYVSEIDVSVDNGRGINEREFVRILLDDFGESVTCILPEPKFPDRFKDDRIEYVLPHNGGMAQYGLHLVAAYRRLRAVNSSRPVSGLVTRLEVAPLVPLFAHRQLGLPIILKTLAVYGVFGRHDRVFRPHRLASRALSRSFRVTIERCLVADTVGAGMADWTRSRFRLADDQLVVIPNGANTDHFIPGDRDHARSTLGLGRFEILIGYVGILGPDRGLETLIDELEAIRGDGLRAGLLLVGDGPLRTQLEELVRSKRLGEHVVFQGQVPYDNVPQIMRALDVGIDLSLLSLETESGRTIPASFSQKLAQYLASGVPVVAWDVPDTCYVADHRVGRLVATGNSAGLRRAVTELARLPECERSEMRARCRTLAEREFSVRELVARRMALWTQRVGADAPPGS